MTLTAGDTRQRLLDEAARRFLDDGYVETSLRTIAEAMGIKAGSIYYHFASKDEILAEVLDTGIERITQSVQQALEGIDDPQERLRAAIHAHLRALFEHGAYTACHVRVFHQAPEHVQRQTTVARDRYERLWDELLADAGVPDGTDRSLARLFLLGALNTAVDWYDERATSLDAVADTFSTLFLAGAGGKDR